MVLDYQLTNFAHSNWIISTNWSKHFVMDWPVVIIVFFFLSSSFRLTNAHTHAHRYLILINAKSLIDFLKYSWILLNLPYTMCSPPTRNLITHICGVHDTAPFIQLNRYTLSTTHIRSHISFQHMLWQKYFAYKIDDK